MGEQVKTAALLLTTLCALSQGSDEMYFLGKLLNTNTFRLVSFDAVAQEWGFSPRPAYLGDVTTYNGVVYSVGGAGAHGGVNVLSFDGTSWNAEPSLPEARASHSVLEYDGKLFVLGGARFAVDTVFSFNGSTWVDEPSMIATRRAAGAVVHNGELCMLGGKRLINVLQSSVECFNGTAWRSLPSMNKRRSHLTAASYGGKMYAIGGDNTFKVESFDGTSWTEMADVPDLPSGALSSFVRNGLLYVFGSSAGVTFDGSTWHTVKPQDFEPFYLRSLDSNGNKCVRAYDAYTNTHTLLPMSQRPHPIFGFVPYEGKVYGVGDSGSSRVYFSSYDGTSWSDEVDLPVPRGSHATVVFQNKIMVIGGQRPAVKDVLSYDGTAWSYEPEMNNDRRGAGAAVHNGQLCVAGGKRIINVKIKTAECFDGANWTDIAPMNNHRGGMFLASYNGLLYAAGGDSDQTVEVYDGVSWNFVADVLLPSGTTGAFVANDRLYVMNYYGDATVYDGSTWQQA